MKVKLEIILDIDVHTHEQAMEVIQEMDYEFSYISPNFDSKGNEREKNLIGFSEIKDVEVL